MASSRKTMKRFLIIAFTLLFAFSAAGHAEGTLDNENRDANALTLIDQQDRLIMPVDSKEPKTKKGISQVTGLKSDEDYQPVLVEINNENGGVFATAPKGILKASVIYEYQTSTNGTMGLCALFQDSLPEKAGPVGNASIGGLLIQDDWKCGYVYNDIALAPDGSETELSYSMKSWIDKYDLTKKHLIFPANVPMTKEWKKCFKLDKELITDESYHVNTRGIKDILTKYEVSPSPSGFTFLDDPDSFEGSVFVREIDIRSSSRTFSSGFIYNDDDHLYYRWIGENNQYGDVEANAQLGVANLIIQRVEYNTSNKNMAPVTIGRGNADIFIRGFYIDGYWVRESSDDHTRFYDSEGNLLCLDPGITFISMLTNSTSVVIRNY